MTIHFFYALRAIAALLFPLAVQWSSAQIVSDSTHAPSKGEPGDSLMATHAPIPGVGSIDRSPGFIMPDSVKSFYDYTYGGDLFAAFPGAYTFDLASPGQLNGTLIDGLDQRTIAFLSDGVSLNEPMSGTLNLFQYPFEQADKIEIISGTSAFYYGLNGNAAAVNFLSKNIKAIHPYTRIRYIQAPHDHTYFDGSFSQDIIRGLNLTVGLFHHTNKGRFNNSDYADWGGRVKLRYNISNHLNVFATGMYVTTNLGLNGGADLAKNPPDLDYSTISPPLVVMVNTDSYEKIHRYDTQVGAAAELFGDSTAVTTMTLYHSTNFREYRDEENRTTPNGRYVAEDTRSQWFGVKLNQHFDIGPSFLDFGFQTERRGIIASDLFPQHLRNLTSVFGKFELFFPEVLSGKILARYDNYFDKSLLSTGIEGTVHLPGGLTISAGTSVSHRFPTFQELHLPDTSFGLLSGSANVEKHTLAEAGFGYSAGQISGALRGFVRTIEGENTIVPLSAASGAPGSTTTTLNGIDLRFTGRFGFLCIQFNAQHVYTEKYTGSTYNPSHLPPEWSGIGGIYFWDKIVGGHLDLKTGIRMRAFSRTHAVEYNPQAQVYFGSTAPPIEGAGVLDYVLIGHLGKAYIHIVMENLFDKQYVTTTFYPMNERNIRFGVSWDFLD